ncbi:MAG TPA: peptidase S51, partial [Thermoanaerobaculia bacterium]|nr:peptidase S51 [Thermoanaerobaculia bacterium]
MTRALLILALLTRFFTGNPDDVKPKLRGPMLLLTGGGGDVTAGLQTAIDRIRNGGKIDVVVLRASGAEGYNPYFMEMRGVDSVESLVITDRASSSRRDVV